MIVSVPFGYVQQWLWYQFLLILSSHNRVAAVLSAPPHISTRFAPPWSGLALCVRVRVGVRVGVRVRVAVRVTGLGLGLGGSNVQRDRPS